MRHFHLSPSALAAEVLAARRAQRQSAMPLYLHAPEQRELLAPAPGWSELTLEDSRITIGDDADDDDF